MKYRFSALILTLGLLMGMAAGPGAQPARAASLKICGEVTVYVKSTLLGTGLLTINGIPMIIGLGVSLPASVAVGADLCLDLTTSLAGLITGAAATANVQTHLKVCGQVTAYTAATATATGLLKVGTRTFTLALGSHLPASVQVGADICVDLELDGFGRVADGTVTANAHINLKVCGEVLAYTQATANATGVLKIGSRTWTTAIDSELPASVDVGADLCIDLEIDGYGRVDDGAVTANVTSTVKVCGVVTAYTEATATAVGLLKAAGNTWNVALGTNLPASVDAGADLCLNLTLNGFGQVKNGTAVANVNATVDVCGQVTAYAAATSTTNGSLTLGGINRTIVAGADVDGGVGVGAYVKLRLETDVFARVAKATVLKAGASLNDACGDGGSPSSTPGASQNPGSSQGPGASQNPGQSQNPGSSGHPGATQNPGPSQGAGATEGPGSSGEPGATQPPSSGEEGVIDCTSGVGGTGNVKGNGDGGTLLPSTDALGRATGVIASNAIPLLAIGLLGGLAAWYRNRRRFDEVPYDDTGIAIEDVASRDGASELRA